MTGKNDMARLFPQATRKDWRNWRWQMQNRIRSLETLAASPAGAALPLARLHKVVSCYPMAITPYYLSLINPDDDTDAIARQCFPDEKELIFADRLTDDPLNEDDFMPVDKLLRRYPDRALILLTNACATYCRHCNRKRHWRQADTTPFKKRIAAMTRYVSAHPEIREVILSGGDPLTYDDETLEYILSSFAAIRHIEVLRIGSRIPAVLPMRITRDLCRMLKRFRPLWFNTQFNAAAEITPESARACLMLQETGIPVSNQSVLLAGVNDSEAALRNLFRGLQKITVRPYYLFHCEPVRGCGHFRTDLRQGVAMMEKLRTSCSGLALPQYVADLPGNAGKTPLWAASGNLKSILDKHQDFFDIFQ